MTDKGGSLLYISTLFAMRFDINDSNHTILIFNVVCFLFMAVKEAELWEKRGGSVQSVDGGMMRHV